jgi:hypothetical protein
MDRILANYNYKGKIPCQQDAKRAIIILLAQECLLLGRMVGDLKQDSLAYREGLRAGRGEFASVLQLVSGELAKGSAWFGRSHGEANKRARVIIAQALDKHRKGSD